MPRVLLLFFLFFVFQLYSYGVNSGGRIKPGPFHIVTNDTAKPIPETTFNISDNLKAPFSINNLSVDTYQSRIAQLHWSSTDPALAGTYIIQRLAPSSVWVDIASLPYTTLAYNDTVSFPFCAATSFSYRIKFISASGLVKDSSEIISPSSPLSDLTSPVNVSNLVVEIRKSIDGYYVTGSWNRITTDSISTYELQRFDPATGSWPVLATGPADYGSFGDLVAACESSYKYIVRTTDRCGNNSAPDYKNKYVQTIKLDVAQPGECVKSAQLKWNAYINMPGGLGGYAVSRTDGLNPPVEVEVTDTSYVDNFNFQDGHSYSYTVKAFSSDHLYSSSSCSNDWTYTALILPDTVYVTQVSVEDDRNITVGYYFSAENSVTRLILERSDDNGITYHAIDSLLFPVPQAHIFTDSSANVHSQSYYYRVKVIDDCDREKQSMNSCSSIWLQCSPLQVQNNLSWNSYESWLQGVEGYDVLRILDTLSVTVKTIATVDAATNSYSDLLTSFDNSKLPCYWVEAKENSGNPIFKNAISKSNTCCVIQEPIIFMPNAFYPEGKNRYFRPVPSPSFLETGSFKMTIFSRWGQQIFETTDIVNGWDGYVNGQYTPAGQYSYIVSYKSLEGKDYTKRGTVMLIR